MHTAIFLYSWGASVWHEAAHTSVESPDDAPSCVAPLLWSSLMYTVGMPLKSTESKHVLCSQYVSPLRPTALSLFDFYVWNRTRSIPIWHVMLLQCQRRWIFTPLARSPSCSCHSLQETPSLCIPERYNSIKEAKSCVISYATWTWCFFLFCTSVLEHVFQGHQMCGFSSLSADAQSVQLSWRHTLFCVNALHNS